MVSQLLVSVGNEKNKCNEEKLKTVQSFWSRSASFIASCEAEQYGRKGIAE